MNTKSALRLLTLSMLATGLLSCSKSSNNPASTNTTTDNQVVPVAQNTMVATIGGTAYSFTCFGFSTVFFGDTLTVIAGADLSGRGVGFGYAGIRSPGSYDIGTIDTTSGNIRLVTMNYQYVASPGDTVMYVTSSVPGSPSVGKLKIVGLTDTTFKATFNATLPKKQGISGTPTVVLTGGINTILQK